MAMQPAMQTNESTATTNSAIAESKILNRWKFFWKNWVFNLITDYQIEGVDLMGDPWSPKVSDGGLSEVLTPGLPALSKNMADTKSTPC